jgi:hypothetical protein
MANKLKNSSFEALFYCSLKSGLNNWGERGKVAIKSEKK